MTNPDQTLDALNRRNRELAALYEIGIILSPPTDLRRALNQVCEQIASLVGMETVIIHLIDPTHSFMEPVAYQGVDANFLAHVRRLGLDDPATRAIALDGKPFATDDVIHYDGAGFAGPRAEGYHAGIGVQIRRRGEPAGTIFVGSKSATRYSRQDVELLGTIANQVGIALENVALYAQMQKRLKELAALAQLSAQLISPPDAQTLFNVTLNHLIEIFDVDACTIRMLEDGALCLRAAHTRIDGIALADSIPLDEQMLAILSHQPAFVVNDMRELPGLHKDLSVRGLHAMLIVPLWMRHQLIGALGLLHTQPRVWQREEQDLVQTIANQVGLAIEKTSLLQETQTRMRELDGLAKLSAACAVSLNPSHVVQNTLHWTRTLLQADIVDVRRLAGKRLEPMPNGTLGAALPFDEPIMLNVLATQFSEQRAPLILHDAPSDSQVPPAVRALFARHHVRAILAVPLIAQDQTIGLLSAIQTKPRVWSAHHVELLHTIANQTANALHNAQLFHQVLKEQHQNMAIIESGLNGVYVTDQRGRIIMFNHAAVRMTGWRREEAIGVLWDDIFADVNNQSAPSLVQQVMATRQPVNSLNGRVIRQRLGAPIPILEAAAPLFDENGDVTGVVGTMWDLTRERQAELERADLLEFFTHELRTPVSNLVSIAQMLDSARLDQTKRAELLELIKKEGRRLRKFADDFLRRNGAFAPAAPVDLETFVVMPLVETVVQRFATNNATHRFRIKSPQPSPVALAERQRLGHILDNLLENAVNYSPDQTLITVTVEEHNAHLTFAVQDQGKGIPAGEQEFIFHRYYRAKHSRGRIAGHGLGLALVRKMVVEMGGTIWVESHPPQGATFCFTVQRPP